MKRRRVVACALAFAAFAALGLTTGSCRRGEPVPAPRPETAATQPAPASPKAPSRFARIDTHMHISPMAVERALALMDRWSIAGAVNLSGMHPGPPNFALELQLKKAARSGGRLRVFMTPNFMRALRERPRDYGVAMAEDVVEGQAMGAVGVKISKGLGLGYPSVDGKSLLAVDDPGLDAMFEKAGALGMPIAIHTGDPKAFWQPPDDKNERRDELFAHPEWSLYDQPVPSWQALLAQFERRVARHPKTIFIGVHFGNAPEEPARVEAMLDRHPNLYIDTAARVPEIGRHDAARMREFFVKYQDRILFATDTGVGETQDEMMYGSTGSTAPTAADEQRFFTATYRYFETQDRQFEHPTPIQGRWKIDGIGLPEAVLRKIYFENAAKLLKWQLPASVSAPAEAPQ